MEKLNLRHDLDVDEEFIFSGEADFICDSSYLNCERLYTLSEDPPHLYTQSYHRFHLWKN